MKAVILAAGEGVRMRPLTLEKPKPLLEVLGKPLIAYTFAALPDAIDEVIVIVKYKEEMIRAVLGNSFMGKKVTYVVQSELNGTAGALWEAKEFLTEKFLVVMSDDMYSKADIERCLVHDWTMMIYQAHTSEKVGSVALNGDGTVREVVEGGAEGSTNPLINTNVFVLEPELFNHALIPKSAGSSEFGLPQTLLAAVPGKVQAVEATFWLSLTEPSDIARAEKVLSQD